MSAGPLHPLSEALVGDCTYARTCHIPRDKDGDDIEDTATPAQWATTYHAPSCIEWRRRHRIKLAAIEAAIRAETHLVPETEALPMGERDCSMVLAWWQEQARRAAIRAESAPTAERLSRALAYHDHGGGIIRIRRDHLTTWMFDDCAEAILAALAAGEGP